MTIGETGKKELWKSIAIALLVTLIILTFAYINEVNEVKKEDFSKGINCYPKTTFLDEEIINQEIICEKEIMKEDLE